MGRMAMRTLLAKFKAFVLRGNVVEYGTTG
jgi:hypothetical protein